MIQIEISVKKFNKCKYKTYVYVNVMRLELYKKSIKSKGELVKVTLL